MLDADKTLEILNNHQHRNYLWHWVKDPNGEILWAEPDEPAGDEFHLTLFEAEAIAEKYEQQSLKAKS